jgi:hypothetical protein
MKKAFKWDGKAGWHTKNALLLHVINFLIKMCSCVNQFDKLKFQKQQINCLTWCLHAQCRGMFVRNFCGFFHASKNKKLFVFHSEVVCAVQVLLVQRKSFVHFKKTRSSWKFSNATWSYFLNFDTINCKSSLLKLWLGVFDTFLRLAG